MSVYGDVHISAGAFKACMEVGYQTPGAGAMDGCEHDVIKLECSGREASMPSH